MTSVRNLFARRELGLAIALVVLVAAVSSRFPAFAKPATLGDIFNDSSILIILALGQMAVLVTRGVDLSVASIVALAGMAAGLFNQAMPGAGVVAAIAVAVVVGLAGGMINGAIVWLLRVPPIVATLGTLAIFRGLVFTASGGAYANALSPGFVDLVRTEILGVRVLSWAAVAAIIAVAVIVRYSKSGRALFAAGSNPGAAIYAGVNVGKSQAFSFVLSGLLAGVGGYLWVARLGVADSTVALGFELQVIAACVIGGVSIAGGSGSVLGVVLGALFLGVINNALPLLGVSPFWQMAISGAIILIAVILNARSTREAPRRILEESDR
jgi:rhamnose transport system permease protein